MRLSSVVAIVVVALTGCRGPYADLEENFSAPSRQSASSPSIPINRIVLLSQKHKGAYSFGRVFEVRLLSTTIELTPVFPFSLAMGVVSVPTESVGGCSRTCFGNGNWEANLIVPTASAQIDLPKSKETIDWCWANKIPMLSAKERDAWLYSSTLLPSRASFTEQLSSREKFDQQGEQSCLGY